MSEDLKSNEFVLDGTVPSDLLLFDFLMRVCLNYYQTTQMVNYCSRGYVAY